MSRLNRYLPAIAGFFVVLTIGACATVAEASQAQRHYLAPQPAVAQLSPHVQREVLTWDERPPLPATRDHFYQDYDHPHISSSAHGGKNGLVAASCDIAGFASASSSSLVSKVKAADASCFYSGGLFDVTGSTAGQIFAESKMITIADAMLVDSATYPGNNADNMLELILFMRAGLYVQFYNSVDVGNYSANWTSAIHGALNAFVASSHFQDVNNAHGEVLSEFITLIDSSEQNADQLDTVRGILDSYGPAWSSHSNMLSAVNNTFTVLFRGHYNNDFQILVQGSGSGILDTLVNFINDNRAADQGSDRQYLLQNAAGELGRFTQYTDPAFHDTLLHPKVKSVLDSFSLTGPGAGIYVRIASVTDYYDHAHCAYFGLCTFASDLETEILPLANARDCSATLRVRSQSLTSAQLDDVCSTVGNEESYFHTVSQTGNVPVADDYNDRLEMVIFQSSSDYQTYSGIIFGNATDNGGMYLEGDPSDPANQARFLAYEAEWMRPTFEVWNLTHEYIHYLDGRFNWYGNFGDYPLDAPYSSVWYIEGFAEYVSYSYRNQVYSGAVAEAANPDTYTLAQLFNNDYATSGQVRTYSWGYMATRFMFERHRDEIADLYAVARLGNYVPGYEAWLDSVRNSHDTEFREWIVCFGTHNGDTSSCGGPAADAIFSDGFEGEPEVVITECTGEDPGRLDNGCKRSNISAASATDRVYLTAFLPAGLTSAQLDMSGGTGDADIYVRVGSWPSESEYDFAPQLPGNEESVTLSNPASDWLYIMLKPRVDSFTDVQVSLRWE